MKTEREIQEKIDELMEVVVHCRKTKDEANKERILCQIDSLMWVIGQGETLGKLI